MPRNDKRRIFRSVSASAGPRVWIQGEGTVVLSELREDEEKWARVVDRVQAGHVPAIIFDVAGFGDIANANHTRVDASDFEQVAESAIGCPLCLNHDDWDPMRHVGEIEGCKVELRDGVNWLIARVSVSDPEVQLGVLRGTLRLFSWGMGECLGRCSVCEEEHTSFDAWMGELPCGHNLGEAVDDKTCESVLIDPKTTELSIVGRPAVEGTAILSQRDKEAPMPAKKDEGEKAPKFNEDDIMAKLDAIEQTANANTEMLSELEARIVAVEGDDDDGDGEGEEGAAPADAEFASKELGERLVTLAVNNAILQNKVLPAAKDDLLAQGKAAFAKAGMAGIDLFECVLKASSVGAQFSSEPAGFSGVGDPESNERQMLEARIERLERNKGKSKYSAKAKAAMQAKIDAYQARL